MFTFHDALFSFEMNIVVVVLYNMFSVQSTILEELGGLFVNLKFFDAIDEFLLVDDGCGGGFSLLPWYLFTSY